MHGCKAKMPDDQSVIGVIGNWIQFPKSGFNIG